MRRNMSNRCQGYVGCTGLKEDGGHCDSCRKHNREIENPKINPANQERFYAMDNVGIAWPENWKGNKVGAPQAERLLKEQGFVLGGLTVDEFLHVNQKDEVDEVIDNPSVPDEVKKPLRQLKARNTTEKQKREARKAWGVIGVKSGEFVHHLHFPIPWSVPGARYADNTPANLIPAAGELNWMVDNGYADIVLDGTDAVVHYFGHEDRFRHFDGLKFPVPQKYFDGFKERLDIRAKGVIAMRDWLNTWGDSQQEAV